MLVDASATESHLDPLTAAPDRNRFLQTVVPVPAQAGTIGAMSERTSYEPGVPSWADLATPDVDASKRFYAGLFGWEAQDAGPAEETGGYAMFTLQGRNVAGLSPVQDENQPPMWSAYVATDDADAAGAARARGGRQRRSSGPWTSWTRGAWRSSRIRPAG